jgi:hypothetical protein
LVSDAWVVTGAWVVSDAWVVAGAWVAGAWVVAGARAGAGSCAAGAGGWSAGGWAAGGWSAGAVVAGPVGSGAAGWGAAGRSRPMTGSTDSPDPPTSVPTAAERAARPAGGTAPPGSADGDGCSSEVHPDRGARSVEGVRRSDGLAGGSNACGKDGG